MKIAVTGDGGAENPPRPKMPQRPEPLTDTWAISCLPTGRSDGSSSRFYDKE